MCLELSHQCDQLIYILLCAMYITYIILLHAVCILLYYYMLCVYYYIILLYAVCILIYCIIHVILLCGVVSLGQLWDGCSGVSNAGKKKGRGKRGSSKRVVNIHLGKRLGYCKSSLYYLMYYCIIQQCYCIIELFYCII